MEDVITLSSDDSDVEVVGSFCGLPSRSDPPPLSEVRVDVAAVNVGIPPHYIDLTDPRWAFPELMFRKRQNSSSPPVIDLTENDTKRIVMDTEKKETEVDTAKKETAVDTAKKETEVDTENLPADVKHKEQKPCLDKLAVKLARLPFLESHATELSTSGFSVHLGQSSSQMPLWLNQLKSSNGAGECDSDFRTTAALNVSHVEPSFLQCLPEVAKSAPGQKENKELASENMQEEESQAQQSPVISLCSGEQSSVTTSKEHRIAKNEKDGLRLSDRIPSPPFTHSSADKPQDEANCTNLNQLELDKESGKSYTCDSSCPHSPGTRVDLCEVFEPYSFSNTSSKSHQQQSQVDPSSNSEHVPAENAQVWQLETETFKEEMGIESPLSLLWQGESEGEDINEENRFGTDFRAVSREDRQFVCPVALRKVMAEPAQASADEDDESFGNPEVLCRQSLSLVYSTIDENYPEGTLQLLSDLLQPGYYPPKDITAHLLRGILLDPQCPYHLCVQAFNLLMRTQRHHMATKSTVPWDWELLTSVMSSEKIRCEVVLMFLEYVVQTLEDDFHAKCSTSALHQSVAKATLSCDRMFPRVRDVIKWMFSAIIKSTEHGERKERDDQLRLVFIFQRMLSLALEVDRSPALNSAKLSQELFHMLLSYAPLRAQRMLLLESLQSKLIRCKLLEHLLDYACPQKISVPMSLSLLLHFLKHCTLAPDPTDDTERWQKWGELIQLLWMLLLSYNTAMKGYLCSSYSEQRIRVGTLVYKSDDMISKPAVQEAVEAFLSRSQEDLGQALPLHVDESLTYLQDHLLDVCQC
ncbi:uncharacterized protein simc1 [Xenentodon cancila]